MMNSQSNKTATVFEQVTISLRPAKMLDLVEPYLLPKEGVPRKMRPKYGQAFFVRSQITGKFDNKNYIITQDTDREELKAWFRQGMIFVPVCGAKLIAQNQINNPAFAKA
jgi:hypothetical protein